MTENIVCSECKCSIDNCNNNEFLNNNLKCRNCIKEICCCIDIHINTLRKKSLSLSSNLSLIVKSKLFFNITKNLLPAALGIEILCIMAAELGENIGLYTFGFNLMGIVLAYVIGYALAGFTTFMTILGRYAGTGLKIESCCSVLEQQSNKGFISNMFLTFGYFAKGIRKIAYLKKEPNLKYILKTSMVILITAESACILTAETIGIVFYNYSIFLSVLLALLVGALTIVIIEAFKKIKMKSRYCNSCDCDNDDDDNKNNNLISLK
ncbi:MAG TPA: hypothetical protein VJ583_02690 [Nitrososphaeraceae archaeon]|nr:hypothetical protein [Nitrososphaeraceae archaeon]